MPPALALGAPAIELIEGCEPELCVSELATISSKNKSNSTELTTGSVKSVTDSDEEGQFLASFDLLHSEP